jgi:hypothetical protein
MARNIKVCEYWIEIPDGGTRRYICPLDDGYGITDSFGDRVVWEDCREMESVLDQLREQYGECYEFGSGMVELDPKPKSWNDNPEPVPDMLQPYYEPIPPQDEATVHSTTRAARNETAFRDMLKNSGCRMRKTADGRAKPLSENTQNRYCSVLAHSHAALSRMGCSHRTMNAVPDSILSCRTLDDVLRVSAVLNADKHFREHSRDIDHNNLRTALGWFIECMKLEGRR